MIFRTAALLFLLTASSASAMELNKNTANKDQKECCSHACLCVGYAAFATAFTCSTLLLNSCINNPSANSMCAINPIQSSRGQLIESVVFTHFAAYGVGSSFREGWAAYMAMRRNSHQHND